MYTMFRYRVANSLSRGQSRWHVATNPCNLLQRVESSSAASTSTTTPSATTTLATTHVFTRPQVDAFCQLTADTNPIHKGTNAIVPGILSASLFPSLISSHFPGSIYASQTLTFRQPISVEEPLEVNLSSRGARHGLMQFTCAIRKLDHAEIGANAVDGTAIVKLPSDS